MITHSYSESRTAFKVGLPSMWHGNDGDINALNEFGNVFWSMEYETLIKLICQISRSPKNPSHVLD